MQTETSQTPLLEKKLMTAANLANSVPATEPNNELVGQSSKAKTTCEGIPLLALRDGGWMISTIHLWTVEIIVEANAGQK